VVKTVFLLGAFRALRGVGLGTQNQKSMAPLVRRVQLRSAYNCLCLLYSKWSTRNRHGPPGVSRSPPVIHRSPLLGPLGGSGDVTPQHKNQVKSMMRVPTIQEPKFSVCGVVFDGGCDGRGCGCHIVLALHAQPSQAPGTVQYFFRRLGPWFPTSASEGLSERGWLWLVAFYHRSQAPSVNFFFLTRPGGVRPGRRSKRECRAGGGGLWR
jgi:hypothetical protein